jgi:ribonuclease P protein component
VTVRYVEHEDGGSGVLVSYAVGRAVGGAVERNRVRRRLRAVLTQGDLVLQPGSYLVGASPEARTVSFQALRRSLRQAVERAVGPDRDGSAR